MSHYSNKKNDQTILSSILIGIWTIIAGIFRLIFKGFGRKRGLSVSVRNHITTKKDEILTMSASENIHELRQSVLEADKLVNYALENSGYSGETLAERLKNARGDIRTNIYEGIWRGHKVRNMLAHEANSRIKDQELRDAVNKLLRYLNSI